MNQNYYQILEINQNASKEEIQDAFKKQSNRYHPDTNKDDPLAKEKFQQVVKAYEVLSNDIKKEVYDETLIFFEKQNAQTNQNQLNQINNSSTSEINNKLDLNNQNLNKLPNLDNQQNQGLNSLPNLNSTQNQSLDGLPNLDHLSDPKNTSVHSSLARTGAILNIVFSSFLAVFNFTILFIFAFSIFISSLYFSFIFLIFFGAFSIGSIFSIVYNLKYLRGKNNKLSAGITGLIFGSVIGGIFILVSK